MAKVDPTAAPIIQGIQTVGVGRDGSRSMSRELAAAIRDDLLTGRVHPVSEGAFWGALMMKSVSDAEQLLAEALPAGALGDPCAMATHLCADTDPETRARCALLLDGKELDREQALELGRFLFADTPGERARGLAASILRVRYETDDEYEGLLTAMRETVVPAFREPVPEGAPIAQVAEPFDGTLRSYLLTPLLARHLKSRGYRPLHLVGRSSGPKFGMNHRDVHRTLGAPFISSNSEVCGETPDFGWAIDQAMLSPAMDAWVDRRHQSKKRPFLATLEKFFDPARASLLVTSAFHPPYTEKMMCVAERAGFPAAIVMRRGIEGSLSPNTAKPVEVLVSVRRENGHYERQAFEWDPAELVDGGPIREVNVAEPKAEDNARLIRQHVETGSSGDPVFDRRVALATALLDRCLAVIGGQAAS